MNSDPKKNVLNRHTYSFLEGFGINKEMIYIEKHFVNISQVSMGRKDDIKYTQRKRSETWPSTTQKHDIEAYLAAFLDLDVKDVRQYMMKMRSKTLSEEIVIKTDASVTFLLGYRNRKFNRSLYGTFNQDGKSK